MLHISLFKRAILLLFIEFWLYCFNSCYINGKSNKFSLKGCSINSIYGFCDITFCCHHIIAILRFAHFIYGISNSLLIGIANSFNRIFLFTNLINRSICIYWTLYIGIYGTTYFINKPLS